MYDLTYPKLNNNNFYKENGWLEGIIVGLYFCASKEKKWEHFVAVHTNSWNNFIRVAHFWYSTIKSPSEHASYGYNNFEGVDFFSNMFFSFFKVSYPNISEKYWVIFWLAMTP